MDISTEEAVAHQLPGHDVYRYAHLLYHDDVNRDAGVVYLCQEARKAFEDTILFGYRGHLDSESARMRDWVQAGGPTLKPTTWLKQPYHDAFLDRINYEHLKIAAGFELILKANLLEQNYLVNIIDSKEPYKALANLQRTQPIQKGEILALGGYRFDGILNYLPGIKASSLSFSTIVKPAAYRDAQAISSHDLDLINEFRELRNEIHFPGEAFSTPVRAAYPGRITDFLRTFINRWVVDRSNELTVRHGLNWPRLQHFA